ncbi:TPA: hypothetical protein ACXJUU_004667 [Serratia marcescens]
MKIKLDKIIKKSPLILLLLGMLPFYCSATLFFQELDWTPDPSGGRQWQISYQLGWGNGNSVANPCFNNGCSDIYIGGQAIKNGIPVSTFMQLTPLRNKLPSGTWQQIIKSGTAGEAEKLLNDNLGLPAVYSRLLTFNPSNADKLRLCVFYSAANGGAVLWPGGLCQDSPPPNVSCELTPYNIIINYGEVASSDVAGKIKNGTVSAMCTAQTSVSLKMLNGSDDIILSAGSLKSKLKLNGVGAGNGITVNATPGGTVVNIESELVATGDVASGEYMGSNVLIMDMN